MPRFCYSTNSPPNHVCSQMSRCHSQPRSCPCGRALYLDVDPNETPKEPSSRESKQSVLGPHRLGEGGDDHKERWFGKARTIGAKMKSQSRGVLNQAFQIETIDGRVTLRHPRGQLQGSQRLRGKLRDGAGNLLLACFTSTSDHGNLLSHAAAARQSHLTIRC